MKNGEKVSELIQSLWSCDKQWETFVLDDENKEKMGNSKISEQIDRLIGAMRQELKEGDREELLEFLQGERLRKVTAEKIVDEAQKHLQFYFAFSILRELESQEETALKGLLSAFYQKYIVRFEPGYFKRLEVGKYTWEDFKEIIGRIDYLTEYYITRSYTVHGMMNDLQDETGLSWSNCEYWANLIDQNYQMLKMNYIVEQFEKLERRLNRFEN